VPISTKEVEKCFLISPCSGPWETPTLFTVCMSCLRQDVDKDHSDAIEPQEFLDWCVKSKHLLQLVVRTCALHVGPSPSGAWSMWLCIAHAACVPSPLVF
jgi:hypothetical protein